MEMEEDLLRKGERVISILYIEDLRYEVHVYIDWKKLEVVKEVFDRNNNLSKNLSQSNFKSREEALKTALAWLD